jgi:ribonuclease HII
MQETLNFGITEKEKIKEIMSNYEKAEVTNYFEEKRAKHLGCTITLYNSGKLSIQGSEAAKVKEEILSMLGLKEDFTIGIDETGRGERTGPMVITGVLADTNSMRELRDSKKTKDIAKKEKIVSEKMLASVSFIINSKAIDLARNSGKNLNQIEAHAIEKISEILSSIADAKIIVDGAPLKVKNQKITFLPKGDDLEPVVGAASIVAKHLRNNSADLGERKTWKNKKIEKQ